MQDASASGVGPQIPGLAVELLAVGASKRCGDARSDHRGAMYRSGHAAKLEPPIPWETARQEKEGNFRNIDADGGISGNRTCMRWRTFLARARPLSSSRRAS